MDRAADRRVHGRMQPERLAAVVVRRHAGRTGRCAAPYVEGSPLLVNSADGVHIEYRIYGKGEPAVVLVHGWACNENYWNAQTPALKAAHYTVVLVDLAGHGASGKNRSDWSMGNYGED